MRRSGRPLTMRMRMDMLLMSSVTRAGVLMLRRWRPVRRWGRARVSARILARHDMHRRTYWRPPGPAVAPAPATAPAAFPTLPGPDKVEPVAAAATAPAGLAAFDAEFDAETEDCFALFVEIKGEDL